MTALFPLPLQPEADPPSEDAGEGEGEGAVARRSGPHRSTLPKGEDVRFPKRFEQFERSEAIERFEQVSI